MDTAAEDNGPNKKDAFFALPSLFFYFCVMETTTETPIQVRLAGRFGDMIKNKQTIVIYRILHGEDPLVNRKATLTLTTVNIQGLPVSNIMNSCTVRNDSVTDEHGFIFCAVNMHNVTSKLSPDGIMLKADLQVAGSPDVAHISPLFYVKARKKPRLEANEKLYSDIAALTSTVLDAVATTQSLMEKMDNLERLLYDFQNKNSPRAAADTEHL